MDERHELGPTRGQSLVDVLDRVLDKGLVVAGDIRINLADVELLTIQIRLLVCSVDKAREIGLEWWKDDRFLTGEHGRDAELAETLARIEERLERLERERIGRGRERDENEER